MIGVPRLSSRTIEPVLTVLRSIGSSKVTSTLELSGTPFAFAAGLTFEMRGARVSGGRVRSKPTSTQ